VILQPATRVNEKQMSSKQTRIVASDLATERR
jgi:hypothetical protein